MVSDFANFEFLEKYDTFYEPKGHFLVKKFSEIVQKNAILAHKLGHNSVKISKIPYVLLLLQALYRKAVYQKQVNWSVFDEFLHFP